MNKIQEAVEQKQFEDNLFSAICNVQRGFMAADDLNRKLNREISARATEDDTLPF